MGIAKNEFFYLKYASNDELNKKISICPNCHCGILDDGKCANDYTYCNIKINELEQAIEKEKLSRGIK
jgi:hypothetical protein